MTVLKSCLDMTTLNLLVIWCDQKLVTFCSRALEVVCWFGRKGFFACSLLAKGDSKRTATTASVGYGYVGMLRAVSCEICAMKKSKDFSPSKECEVWLIVDWAFFVRLWLFFVTFFSLRLVLIFCCVRVQVRVLLAAFFIRIRTFFPESHHSGHSVLEY